MLQVGFRVAPTRGGFGTIDFAFATFPEAVSQGISLSGGGGGAVVGYNVGAGLVLRGSSKLGFRFDYTYRRFRDLEQPLSSITAGVVFLP